MRRSAIRALAELFPRVRFLLTDLRWHWHRVVPFYNQRGTAEQWIREGNIALHRPRLSCHTFLGEAVRLQLFAVAYNLGDFLRRLVLFGSSGVTLINFCHSSRLTLEGSSIRMPTATGAASFSP